MSKKTEYSNLEELLERIKTITWIERIFSWGSIRSLSYDAYEELKSIDKITELKITEAKEKLEIENAKLSEEIKQLNNKDKENIKCIAEFKSIKDKEQKDYIKNIEQLNKSQEQLENQRSKLQEEREQEMQKHYEDMKKTWKDHEQNVADRLVLICEKHHLEYIPKDKVEFKGKPDNTIKIGDQYVIFDAKSPANDNLENFPKYIKDQTKILDKYIKEKDVRKSIYLVVPHNTIEVINEYFMQISNYKVYIVSIDSLEPIIESLEEILNYKFTDQLSPEQRDKIAEIIGRFAHSTKRKIQIDNWMNQNFLDILDGCNDLDSNTKDQSAEIERSYTLNPEMDKKGKLIDSSKLYDEIKIIDHKRELKDQKLLKSKK